MKTIDVWGFGAILSWLFVFNTTFNIISVVSWQSVLLVMKSVVP